MLSWKPHLNKLLVCGHIHIIYFLIIFFGFNPKWTIIWF
jgi:hypothetical protein